MVTLFFVIAFSALGVALLAPRDQWRAWLGPLIGLFFLLLFLTEAVLQGTEIFISDENFFLDQGRFGNLTAFSERYLWILINAVILRYDLSAWGLPLKLVNLPLLALLIALLWRIFDRDRLIWWIPLALPYMAYTAVFNLRDIAILTATAGCVFFLSEGRGARRLLFFPTAAVFYLLRAPMALASAAIWLTVLTISGFRRVVKGRVPLKGMVLVGGGLAVVAGGFAGPVLDQAERRIIWYSYALGDKYSERAVERGVEREHTESVKSQLVVGAGRYALAPLPTSLLTRILSGGSEQWGLVDDLVRMIHQLLYYAIIAFLLVHWRHWIRAATFLSRGQIMLLASLALYFPTYSIYHFGLSHQRVKIPLQLAICLFAITVYRIRKKI